MSQRAKAVLCRAVDQAVIVEEIEVESPRRDEVMIKLAACGVCHSDLSATNGTIPFPLPLVLGHEGAGVVVEVGEGVSTFAVGDTVVKHSDIYNAAYMKYTDDSPPTWRCCHEEAANCRS